MPSNIPNPQKTGFVCDVCSQEVDTVTEWMEREVGRSQRERGEERRGEGVVLWKRGSQMIFTSSALSSLCCSSSSNDGGKTE